MIALISTVLPVIAIIGLGAIADRCLKLDLPTLSRLVLYVLSPALMVDVLDRTEMSSTSAVELTWGFTLAYFLLGAIGWLVGRSFHLDRPTCTSLIATTAFPNTGNMGLSISLFAFGEVGFDQATVVLLVSSILVFSTGPALLVGGGWRKALKLTLQLPLIWAVVLGLVLRSMPQSLPLNLDRGLHLLAESTVPIALLMLGMQISRHPIRFSGYTIGASLMRAIGGAVVGAIVTLLLHINGLEQQILILQCSMPAAVTSFVMANELGGDGARTGQVVAVSTLLSFVTLPCILWAIVTFKS